MLGKGRERWIMYLHADDKWVCSYIHLLLHMFGLQFRLPLYLNTSPQWLWTCLRLFKYLYWSFNPRRIHLLRTRKMLHSVSVEYISPFFPPSLSAACVNCCKTLCTMSSLRLLSFTSTSVLLFFVHICRSTEERKSLDKHTKFCKVFWKYKGNASWGDAAGLQAVEVRDASERQRLHTKAGKCYHW